MNPDSIQLPKSIEKYGCNLDHVAIAVHDLETSIKWYSQVLGFRLTERRTTIGKKTGMVSAVMEAGKLNFVLIQGTSPESQVSRYIENYGAGVQHIAIRVEDLPNLVEELQEAGMEFDTTIIHSPGLRQIFSKRDKGSGMMIELIERMDKDATFSDIGVQQLFDQLENNDAY